MYGLPASGETVGPGPLEVGVVEPPEVGPGEEGPGLEVPPLPPGLIREETLKQRSAIEECLLTSIELDTSTANKSSASSRTEASSMYAQYQSLTAVQLEAIIRSQVRDVAQKETYVEPATQVLAPSIGRLCQHPCRGLNRPITYSIRYHHTGLEIVY